MLELELISDYLIENNFASSYEDAINIISVMSESWLEDILSNDSMNYLYERRRFKAVKGPDGKLMKVKQTKTPLTEIIPAKTHLGPKSVRKGPDGRWRTRRTGNFTTQSHEVLTQGARLGLAKQGMYRGTRPDLARRGLMIIPPEEHHSGFSDTGPHSHGPGGHLRGVKKQRGKKQGREIKRVGAPSHWRVTEPETPVSKLKSHRQLQNQLDLKWRSPATTTTERNRIEPLLDKPYSRLAELRSRKENRKKKRLARRQRAISKLERAARGRTPSVGGSSGGVRFAGPKAGQLAPKRAHTGRKEALEKFASKLS